MSARPLSAAEVDLDDPDGLLAADRLGLLRAASMAGAQVRATAAALNEGDLDSVRSDTPPRTIVWVAGHGTAETAGTMLAVQLGQTIGAPIVVASEAPPWIGALDVLVVAGDDPGHPALVTAAATAVRRGARVIVVAPYEGPLRDATAGRSVALPPRLPVPDDFTLARYLAAGLAVLQAIAPGFSVDLAALADELDAEALRNSAGRDLFTNPAKGLAERMQGRQVVFAGDSAATLALARHACTVMLRIAHQAVAAVGLTDALVAIGSGWGRDTGSDAASIFHDEEIDGPLPPRTRTIVLTTDAERPAVSARLRGFDDVHVVNANDVPDAPEVRDQGGNSELGSATMPGSTRPEQQLALLAVRLEMAAVYQRLVRG
ncbi:TobH protein [Mycolicibacterium sp. BiH015]|uniref:TobH protein n=1 Tax=Mycolicibacterium sp. BiH015 TaxID=3018808 RepID=UPI0022E67C68|nr:TobH protein [Mycolicibacterium sp. BiH015]MDA2894452.1 TobH protein [Mycolicibacterium sp. BiH015]